MVAQNAGYANMLKNVSDAFSNGIKSENLSKDNYMAKTKPGYNSYGANKGLYGKIANSLGYNNKSGGYRGNVLGKGYSASKGGSYSKGINPSSSYGLSAGLGYSASSSSGASTSGSGSGGSGSGASGGGK